MAERLCFRCKTNKTGGPEDISFNHSGMPVEIFKNGGECAACAEAKWIERFEKSGIRELIEVVDGKPKVDWQRCFSSGEERNKSRAVLLIDLGILSHYAEGNWEIVAVGPIGLNPRSYLATYLYFTRKEDAVEFARLNYGNTLYHWEIHHISEVIEKEKVK